MPSPCLFLEGLSFGYNGTPVLHGLDHLFEPGLVHGVIGPNGSGKSTLLDLISGHLRPDHGTVRLGDTTVTELSPSALAREMALVPQQVDFHFPFTVFEVVLMGRHPHIPRFEHPSKNDLALVRRALDQTDLTRLADRPMGDLSGGERQRTVFARALAQDTPCLLLDEPTAHMDIRHELAAMTELNRLAREQGRTVITVLHDLNLAAGYCDRLLLLHKGRIHGHGPTGEVLTEAAIRAVFDVRARVTRTSDSATPVITYTPDQRTR